MNDSGLLAGRRIGLIVTGSISAYKSAELLRELQGVGATVQVAMTPGAQKFITPLTLQTLSGRPVFTDLWNLAEEGEIGHIRYADSAETIVVAPASASFIARYAAGIADDAPTAILLATKAPVVLCPAMNSNMFTHPATVENLSKLHSRGVDIVQPESGELACGWIGPGRLPAAATILQRIRRALTPQSLSGRKILVTAGPTRERFDAVRFLSNHSSGRMGIAIAYAAWARGAEVTLILGPTAESVPTEFAVIPVESAAEMYQETLKFGGDTILSGGIVFKAAAVSDLRVAQPATNKVKIDKSRLQQIEFEPTTDILQELCKYRAEIRDRDPTRKLGQIVGFAAESEVGEELLTVAREKLQRKGADMIVANNISVAMGGKTNQVWIIGSDGTTKPIPHGSKDSIAEQILDTLCP